jgi:hypothetical protein
VEQNEGAVHEAYGLVTVCEQLDAVTVRTMVLPEQEYAVVGVHETLSVAPEPLHDAVPLGPVHEQVYEVDDDGHTDVEPEVPTVPTPEMVQLVALLEDHVSVEHCPCVSVEGDIENVAVGGFTVSVAGHVAEPPEPETEPP